MPEIIRNPKYIGGRSELKAPKLRNLLTIVRIRLELIAWGQMSVELHFCDPFEHLPLVWARKDVLGTVLDFKSECVLALRVLRVLLALGSVDVDWRSGGDVVYELLLVLEEAQKLSAQDAVVVLPRADRRFLTAALLALFAVEESFHVNGANVFPATSLADGLGATGVERRGLGHLNGLDRDDVGGLGEDISDLDGSWR